MNNRGRKKGSMGVGVPEGAQKMRARICPRQVLEETLLQARLIKRDLEKERKRFERIYAKRYGDDPETEETAMPQWLFDRIAENEKIIGKLTYELKTHDRFLKPKELTADDLKNIAADSGVEQYLSNEQLLAECMRRGFLRDDEDERETVQ